MRRTKLKPQVIPTPKRVFYFGLSNPWLNVQQAKLQAWVFDERTAFSMCHRHRITSLGTLSI